MALVVSPKKVVTSERAYNSYTILAVVQEIMSDGNETTNERTYQRTNQATNQVSMSTCPFSSSHPRVAGGSTKVPCLKYRISAAWAIVTVKVGKWGSRESRHKDACHYLALELTGVFIGIRTLIQGPYSH